MVVGVWGRLSLGGTNRGRIGGRECIEPHLGLGLVDLAFALHGLGDLVGVEIEGGCASGVIDTVLVFASAVDLALRVRGDHIARIESGFQSQLLDAGDDGLAFRHDVDDGVATRLLCLLFRHGFQCCRPIDAIGERVATDSGTDLTLKGLGNGWCGLDRLAPIVIDVIDGIGGTDEQTQVSRGILGSLDPVEELPVLGGDLLASVVDEVGCTLDHRSDVADELDEAGASAGGGGLGDGFTHAVFVERLTSGMTRRSERSGSRLNLVASAVASSLPVRSPVGSWGWLPWGCARGSLTGTVAITIRGLGDRRRLRGRWLVPIRTSSKSDMCHYVRAFLLEPHPFSRGMGQINGYLRPETDPGVRRDP